MIIEKSEETLFRQDDLQVSRECVAGRSQMKITVRRDMPGGFYVPLFSRSEALTMIKLLKAAVNREEEE